MSATSTVDWSQLQDAYGEASAVPALLEKLASTRGKVQYRVADELCSHVLHQGTIYSASPPAVTRLIEMLPAMKAKERVMIYSLLSGFAEAARTAIHDGHAIACCAGGDPEDGAAIQKELHDAHTLFAGDLADSDASIRGHSGELLTAFAEAEPRGVVQVRARYFLETDEEVRRLLIHGLVRTRKQIAEWPEFLQAAIQKEVTAGNRYVLRQVQVLDMGTSAEGDAVEDLIATFVQTHADQQYWLDDDSFFEAVSTLGPDREFTAFFRAFDLASGDLVRILAERLLRLIFDDTRTGWGQVSYGQLNEDGSKPARSGMPGMVFRALGMLIMIKLFPFWWKRKIRKAAKESTGIRNIRYSGLEGGAPSIPAHLDNRQRAVLTAFVDKSALWEFRTNLWTLFGLPDRAEDLKRFIADRT